MVTFRNIIIIIIIIIIRYPLTMLFISGKTSTGDEVDQFDPYKGSAGDGRLPTLSSRGGTIP